MRFFIVVDHPWTQSFTHAILKRVTTTLEAGGHAVDALDLHTDRFDPVLHVEELAGYSEGIYLDPKVGDYQQRIKQADYLIFIFPVWWEVMPAMLKGFFDKVFLPGWAFRNEDISPLLGHIQGAMVITTMGAPEPIYTSIDRVLLKGILEFCGISSSVWFNLCEAQNKTDAQREDWLNEIDAHLRALK